MNLAFSDINTAFSNLIQADALPSGINSFAGSENRRSLFADNLNQVIKDAKAAQAAVSTTSDTAGIRVSGKQETLENAKNMFLEEVDQEQGMAFVSKLQNLLLTLSGGDLDKITIDAKGLEALKKMLLKAGFEEGKIEEVLSGLSEKAEGKDLSLKDVMAGLLKLSIDNKEDTDDEENLMATSALPFLTTILTSLGLPKETVNQILSQADRGQKGISLDVVIDQLKSIETKSLETGTSFQTREGDTSFAMLFEQLGLDLPGTSRLGLGDLLASLEFHKAKMIDAKNQAESLTGNGLANGTDERVKASSQTLMASLFKHLEIQSAKTDVAEFSYEQIKDQFETDLLIPDKDKPNKNKLFSQIDKADQAGSPVKSDQFFKELESVLSGKSGPYIDSGSRFKEEEAMTKGSKSESAKTGESLQMSADVKTDSLGTALKAKETFRSMPTYVVNQVEKSIVKAVNQGESTLKIQLKPAELGRLVITIDNVGTSMKVSITTESQAAKDILTAHVNELKTVLAAAGISLDKFDVDMNSGFKQSLADTKNQSDNSNRKNRGREKSGVDSLLSEGQQAGNLTAAIQDGSYHFVA